MTVLQPTTADALLQHLLALDIQLYLEGETLRFRAPTGVFTPELKSAVKAAKTGLIELLRQPATTDRPTATVIFPADRSQPLRMSFSQERIWFLYRLEGPSSTYNITPVFRLRGHLDQTAMTGALDALVSRHETLRMRFAENDGIGVQIVDPPTPVAVDKIDLTHLPLAERMPAAERIILERTALPFDLDRGPVLKVSLLVLGEDDHILLPFMHHIIGDGWSLGIFHREFCLFYEALATGKTASLSPLPIQYPDYAVWLRCRQQGEQAQAGLEFWRHALLGAPQTLTLPTDFPRPAVKGFQGRVLHQDIPLAMTQALQELARQQGCSLFMVLLAAYGVLLQSHCGQDDILIGSPVANRPLRETEGLIGCFVNTVILRLQLAGNPSFVELLQRVRQMALDAYAHQDVPVESVIDAVVVQRDPSRIPLYQAQFSLQNVPGGTAHFSSLAVEAMRMDRVAAKNDVSFILELKADGIAVELEYNTDLFRESTIQRLGADYQALLVGLLAAPDGAIGDLLLSEPVARSLPSIRASSAVTFDYPDLVTAFTAAVAAWPNAIAVQDDHQSVDYATLDRYSDAVADHLLSLRLPQETPVGLLFDRSVSLIVAIVGVLKAGSAYLPLAPEHPSERLRYCLHKGGAGALLCDSTHAARAAEVVPSGLPVCSVDAALLSALPNGLPRPAPDADRLAYVIFTSGSTGQPKGVMIEHRAVLNLVGALQEKIYGDAGQGLKVALMASPVFDASVQQIFPSLLLGHRLCLIDEKLRQDGAALCQRLVDWQIEVSDCTPSLLTLMVRGGLAHVGGLRLRNLLVGGEPLPRDLLTELYAGSVGRQIVVTNVYGPTECCVDVSYLHLTPEHLSRSLPATAIIPIGYPLPGCRLVLVDEQDRLLPPGQVGELLIAGICLSRGYVNDPLRTTERFVTLPQLGLERAYRSGDLCCQRPDGVIEFIGRSDDQVKILGYRIELGEIENRLRQHPAIAAACVKARRGSDGHQQLAAYLVCRAELSRHEIHGFLCQTLPDYMVPAYFVRLDALPLNVSGKVERNALPDPEDTDHVSNLASGIVYQAASSPAEAALVDVWQQTLHVEQIGVNDNYFASGGDSIKALQVAARLRAAGWIMEIRDLFQCPCIAQLAPRLKMVHGTAPIASAPYAGRAPLSAVQRFFFATYGPARQFNQAILLRCRQPVTASALTAALDILHREHDALRCRFRQDAEGWHQEFLANATPNFQHIDLRHVSDPQQQLLAHCNGAQQSFELGQAPLFSTLLFELTDGQCLLLSAHHLIVDGVSWRILIEDLEQLLNGAQQLPAASSRYPAWVASQEAWARSVSGEEQAWWSRPALMAAHHLHADYPASGQDTHADRREIRAALGAERTRELITDAQRSYSTEINDLLLAALVRAWCAWSGDSRCALTLEGHGREALDDDLELSRSVGWFTSIFPVAFALAPGDQDQQIRAQIKAVKEGLRVIPHKGAGYTILRYLAGMPGMVELPPLAFNYLGRFDGEAGDYFAPAPETLASTASPDLALAWPLEITAAIVTDRLEITLAYSARRFAPATAQRLIDALVGELEQVIAHALGCQQVELTISDIDYDSFTQDGLETFLATLAEQGPVENIYRLTPLQEGMYFHAQSDSNSAAYFEQSCLRLKGSLQPELVRAVWTELSRRHEALRSLFTSGDGRHPLQVILRRREVPIITLDLTDLSPEEAETRLVAARVEDVQRGFCLDAEPLVRLLLVRVDENQWEIVWSHHHIILDGWSTAVVQQEFVATYSALLAARPSALAPAFPFSRFVKSLPVTPDLSFWQHYLAGYEEVAELPRQKGEGTPELRRHYCDLPVANRVRLDELCRLVGCTVSVFLQAVWGILLGRYANSDDVVFGYVFSGRSSELPGIESAVGLFINTLPVRVRLNPGESFRQLLARLHADAAELAARQQTPLVDIQRIVMNGGSLFSHVLALENYPVDEALLHLDPAVTGFETIAVLSNDRTHYDFDLVVLPGADGLRFRFSYVRSVHDDGLVACIGTQLLHVIDCLLEDPDCDPCRLNILPPDQWRAMVQECNACAAAYPDRHTLSDLFAVQVQSRPEAPALLAPHGEDRWWTYRELADKAAALGQLLCRNGVAEGHRVAIFLPPAEHSIVALLGILHVGAAYVPIDPEYPPERIAFILDDAGVGAVVTSRACRDRLPPLSVPVFEVETLPRFAGEVTAARVSPDATAYVIYTSGSTGTPKGCEISHRNVIRLLCNERFDFSFGPDDTWIMAHSLSFDFSVWEIYGALLYGGRLLLPSREAVRDVPEFHSLLHRHRVSVLNQTPLAFYNLIAFESSLEAHHLDAHLRYVVFGGDRLTPARLQPWVEFYSLDQVALINMYGITETTVHVTFCRLLPEHLQAQTSPIGRPLPETTVYVVDRHLNPQPVGAPGELVVGGSGVGKGYLNRPELTAERFVANPIDPFGGGRLYRSGDLGYRTADGQLFYLGRNDHQVKIRGHRIEPGEIEAAIRSLPGVMQAVVLPESGVAGLELSAYVVSSGDPEGLRTKLAHRLPAHMLPTHMICCAAFPMTANGKLDRQALLRQRVRQRDVPGEDSVHQPPQGEHERLLAEVWRSVLGVERVGRHDRYLSLGGDSIKSIQVLARLRAKGLSLQLKDLFRYPTVAELAPQLMPLLTPLNHGAEDTARPFPLTPIQLRFFSEFATDRHHYNHAVLLTCAAGTSSEHLHQAAQALVDRHDAFRLRFQQQPDGGWLQRVAPRGEPVDYASIAVPDTDALTVHADAEQRRLDIERGPLLRVIHYHLADGTGRLLLIAHHLCVDGVSWRIIHEDLSLALVQCRQAQPILLPPATDSYSRWSTVLGEWHGNLAGELPYWQDMDTAPTTISPELVAAGYYGDASESGFSLSYAATQNLKQAGQAYQTNVGELLLAAFTRALGDWSGANCLQIALESHGRDAVEQCDVSRTIGWFTALYPLRLSLSGLTVERQIKETKEALRRVPHGGLGYGVLRYLGSQDFGLNARPSVCFNYLGEFTEATEAGSDAVLFPCTDAVGTVVSPRGRRPFALELSASIVGGRLQCRLGYAVTQLPESRVRTLSRALENELEALVAHCLVRTGPELTPSDLTYKGLSLDELDSIFDEN